MKNLWKKTSKTYKIIALVISIVMVLTPIYIHLDRRYNSKAEEPMSVSEYTLKSSDFTSGSISVEGDDVTYSGGIATKNVYTVTDKITLKTVRTIPLTEFTSISGTGDNTDVQLTYSINDVEKTDAELSSMTIAENPITVKINAKVIGGDPEPTGSAYVTTLTFIKDTSTYGLEWKTGSNKVDTAKYYKSSDVSINYLSGNISSSDINLTKVKYACFKYVNDKNAYNDYITNVSAWNDSISVPTESGEYIAFAGIFVNDSLFKANSGERLNIDNDGPTVKIGCELKKGEEKWNESKWIDKEFADKNSWSYSIKVEDKSEVEKVYFKIGDNEQTFSLKDGVYELPLANILNDDYSYENIELYAKDKISNITKIDNFPKVKLDKDSPTVVVLEIDGKAEKHYANRGSKLEYKASDASSGVNEVYFYAKNSKSNDFELITTSSNTGKIDVSDVLKKENNTIEYENIIKIQAYDFAEHSGESNEYIIYYDEDNPTIDDGSLLYSDSTTEPGKEKTLEDVTVDSTKDEDYKIYFSADDKCLDESSGVVTLSPQSGSDIPISCSYDSENGRYVAVFNSGDLPIGIYNVKFFCKDLAGNEASYTLENAIKKVEPLLDIKKRVLIVNGVEETIPGDLIPEDEETKETNKKVQLYVEFDSSFKLDKASLKCGSTTLYDDDLSGIEIDNKTKRYYGKETWTIPIDEIKKNEMYKNLVFTVSDTNPTDGKCTQSFNVYNVLFDITEPVVEIENDSELDDKWHNSVKLKYNVKIPKTDESELDKSWLTVDGANKECTLDSTEDKTSYTLYNYAPYEVDESKSIKGTVVAINAKDKAGNVNDGVVRTIKVDKTKPIINNVKIGGYSKGGINRASGDFKIDFDVTDNLSYDRVNVAIYKGSEKVTDGEFKFPGFESGKFSIKMSDVLKSDNKKLEDGTYKMSVIAYDLADNASEEYTKTFTLDNKAPELALEVSGDSTYNNSYYRKQVVVTATAEDDGIDGDNLILADNGKEIKDINWQKNGSKLTATFKVSEADYHHITLDGSDLANNKGTTAEAKFVIDKKNPEVTSLTVNGKVVDGDILTGTPEIRVEVKDDFALKCYKIKVITPDGTSVVRPPVNYHGKIDKKNMTKKYTYELPELISDKASDGKYKIAIDLEDMAGHTIRTTPVSFTLDNTKPVFDIKVDKGNSAKKNTYYNSDVTVKYICWDNNFDKNYMIPIDNNEQVPVEWIKENGAHVAYYTTGSEGYHLLTINGTDAVMKKGKEQRESFVIDKNAPTIDVLLNGGQIYNESMGSVNMTGPAVVTATVKDAYVDNDDFLCQVIKAAPDQPVVNGSFVKTKERTFTFEEEADYTVNFQTRDLANNESKGRSVKFRVDKTAPELSCTAGANGTATAATTVSFTMKEAFWSDASGKIDIFRKGGDGQAESLYKTIEIKPTGQTTSISESFSETGVYRFELEAKDFVGHSATLSQSLTLDTSKPVIKITGVNNYDKSNKAVDFSATIEEEFFASKVVKVEGYRVDADGKKNKIDFSYAPAAPVTSIINNFKEDGIYTIKIEATDPAGNKESQEVTFTIDTSKPKINSSLISGLKNSINKFELKLDAEDLVTDLTVCDVHLFLNGSEFDGESDIEDGHYVLRLTAKDELGNSIDEEIADFTLDTKAPVIIITGVEDGEVKDEAYSINVSLQIAEDTLESVTLNNKEMAINNNTCQIDIADKGDYVLEVNAIDDAGNKVNQVLKFEYGSKSSLLWILLISAAVLLILGVTVTIIVKNKK